MTYNNRELCLIWLDSFIGLEYKYKREIYKLIADCDGIKTALAKSENYVRENVGEKSFATLLASANGGYLDSVVNGLERRKIKAVTIESEEYPEKLKNTSHPPLVLYAKGNTKLLKTETFAVVGARKCLPLSKKLAENFTRALCSGGFTVITGIAEGIDSTVIKTALQDRKPIISVIAGGFDNIYPSLNAALAEDIVKNGLLLSEYTPESAALPFMFPVRNRIIAGMSVGTLVVAAGIRSGTMYTANYTVDYGGDLFAIPYSVGIETGAGCNSLIKRGALLVDSPEDILLFYGKESQSQKTELNELETEILAVLDGGGKHIEKIGEALGKKTFEIASVLTALEIKGVVVKTGTNVYAKLL